METCTEDIEHTGSIRRVTWIGLGINLVLSFAKFAAGLIGHSQAVVADAVHSLSDTTTDIAILVGVRYWMRHPDSDHPYGHRRLEIVITFGIGLALAVVAAGLLWNAIVTLEQRHDRPPGWIAFAAAMASLVSKELLYRWTVAVGRRIKSRAVIANAWHHRSDALSSIPAALAVAGAIIGQGLTFLDHLGAVVVSVFILHAAFAIIFPTLNQLIDRGASEEQLERVRAVALESPGVMSAHRIRTRYIGGSSLAVDLHIEVDSTMSVREGHDISEDVKARLLAEIDEVVDVLVHLEPHEPGGDEAE